MSPWMQQLDWAKRHTPHTDRNLARLKARPDVEVVICFHIDLKMIPVIEALHSKYSLSVVACNLESVDREGWNYLEQKVGVELLHQKQARERLDRPRTMPSGRYLCDLGGELICHALNRPASVTAAMEGTTTGVTRVREALGKNVPGFPLLDWNSAPLKQHIHNEKMVGFSVWQTFTEVTRLSLHGKRVGILGFGAVGRGLARTARSLGGIVSVFDPDPGASMVAQFEGFLTQERREFLAQSEVIVTATGRAGALKAEDLEALPQGAVLLNAGHGSEELADDIRHHGDRRSLLRHVEELRWGLDSERYCYLLSRGELLNLSAGFGDTLNGFDLTSAQLVAGLGFLVEESPHLKKCWHQLPANFSRAVLTL